MEEEDKGTDKEQEQEEANYSIFLNMGEVVGTEVVE